MCSTYTVTKIRYQVLHLQVSGYNFGVQPGEMPLSALYGVHTKPFENVSPFA